MTRIGAMRQRITLQAPVRVADGQGGFSLTWQDQVTVWAEVLELGGREYILAQQLGTALTHQVTLRYHTGLVASWRIVGDDGRVLDVRSVSNPDAVRRYHSLLCEQVIPSID